MGIIDRFHFSPLTITNYPLPITNFYMNPTVAISNLHHAFGKGNLRKEVLINVNLNINPGEICIFNWSFW